MRVLLVKSTTHVWIQPSSSLLSHSEVLYPVQTEPLSCSPQWWHLVLSLSSGTPPPSLPFSQLMSKWSVSLRNLRPLSTNSFSFPLKSHYLSYLCPHLSPRFQISWSSAGSHFVKKFPGSYIAMKCPPRPYVYHQSFPSPLSHLPMALTERLNPQSPLHIPHLVEIHSF